MIELGDSDELLREIDRLCERRDWPGLLRLRNLCRAATKRGKQLWGAAGHAEYRMALEASPEFAAPMTDADPGRFVLGPLTEVMASTHTWAELEPHLPKGPTYAAVAYERVLRGEDLSNIDELQIAVEEFGMPLKLQQWEPEYTLAEYKEYELFAPAPAYKLLEAVQLETKTGKPQFKDPGVDALHSLVQPWLAGSNGKVDISVVEGGLAEVLNPFAVRSASRIEAKDALARMAWATQWGSPRRKAGHCIRPGQVVVGVGQHGAG